MTLSYDDFLSILTHTPLSGLEGDLQKLIESQLDLNLHGDLPRWIDALQQMPNANPSDVRLDQGMIQVGKAADLRKGDESILKQALKGLHPWRKGPFRLFGIEIDTEWRSDWKWDRIKDHIQPLAGRCVLDIGCSNGYHLWRMAFHNPRLAVGIEPKPCFICQFFTLQKYIQRHNVAVLPGYLEDFPMSCSGFDTVFSLGLLYHRREPAEHLKRLFQLLTPGGELVLESLVIDGQKGEVLNPTGRYAKMKNVYQIPSVGTLEEWINECGFGEVRRVDVSVTSTDEQRSTEWMTFESLPDFLDPDDSALTIEGYPRPKRAIVLARRP